MIEKWPPWSCETEKEAITRERKLFSEICICKPLAFSEDYAVQFVTRTPYTGTRLATDTQTHVHRQTDRLCDYSNPLAHARRSSVHYMYIPADVDGCECIAELVLGDGLTMEWGEDVVALVREVVVVNDTTAAVDEGSGAFVDRWSTSVMGAEWAWSELAGTC